MKSIAPYFQLYTDYMAKFENAIKTLNDMSAKNEKFSQIVKDLEVCFLFARAVRIYSVHVYLYVRCWF